MRNSELRHLVFIASFFLFQQIHRHRSTRRLPPQWQRKLRLHEGMPVSVCSTWQSQESKESKSNVTQASNKQDLPRGRFNSRGKCSQRRSILYQRHAECKTCVWVSVSFAWWHGVRWGTQDVAKSTALHLSTEDVIAEISTLPPFLQEL